MTTPLLLLVPVSLLTALSLLLAWRLEPRTLALQTVWIGLATSGLVFCAWVSRRASTAPWSFVCHALSGALLALAMGASLAGLSVRHVRLGPATINVPELFCLVALLSAPFVATRVTSPRRRFALIAWVPLFATLLDSANAAVATGLGAAAMWTRLGGRAAIAGLFLSPAVFRLGTSKWTRPTDYPERLQVAGLDLVLFDAETGANAHTEYVLAHVARLYGGIAALLTWLLAGAVCLALLHAAADQRQSASRALTAGLAAILAGQLILNTCVVMGYLQTPASSVIVPFASYSGTYLIVTACALGVVLQRLTAESLRRSSR